MNNYQMNTVILLVFLFPATVLAVTFDHYQQGETDITSMSVSIPSNAQIVRLHHNSLGVSGIPATFFQGYAVLWHLGRFHYTDRTDC